MLQVTLGSSIKKLTFCRGKLSTILARKSGPNEYYNKKRYAMFKTGLLFLRGISRDCQWFSFKNIIIVWD